MGRLVWTETLYGWHSDRYTIELAAPQLWVLSRRPRRGEVTPIGTWSVIGTAGSLRELKAAAAELERRRNRRRVLLIHLAIVVTLACLAVIAAALDWALVIPAVIAVVALSLRALVMWIESVTGNAWSGLSQHYQ
jgi:CHASE2 domain-containing sensor protein